MKRLLVPLLAASLLVPPAVLADPPKPIVLTFRPAAAPVPALRYRLSPELWEQEPGNAVEWGITERLRADGIGALLPELQRMREAGRLLSLRARLQMAQGHFGDAVGSLETGLTLGRHIGEGPTLISSLVGIAIGQIM